jgi:hypothetical protein
VTADVLPDAIKFIRGYLITKPALTSLVGQRISTRSAATIVYPYLTLQRIGGIPAVPQRLDSARIQVEAWDDTEGGASLVARTARALLHDMEGHSTEEAVCTGVDDDLGLSWVPDTSRTGDAVRTPPTPRWLFGVTVHLHALP